MQILTEPKNALTKQYAKLFEMESVDLEFRSDALKAVARKALERKTGARGLRSILEGVLLDTMYEIPSKKDVSKVVIDESVIEGTSQPLMIYETANRKPKPHQTPDSGNGRFSVASKKGAYGPLSAFPVQALVISQACPHIRSKHHFHRFPAIRPL